MANKVEIEISGREEKLINALRQSETRINAFGGRTISTFSRVNASLSNLGGRYMNAIAGLGIGYGMVKMTQDMMDFDGGLRQIRRTAGLTEQDLQALRSDILGLISPDAKTKISATKGAWVDMAKALNGAGVEFKTIRDILPEVGKGAIAGAVNPQLYAAVIGEMIDKYKVALSDLPKLQEQLNEAMKMPDVRKNPEAFLTGLDELAKVMMEMRSSGMKNVTPLIALYAELTSRMGTAGAGAGAIDSIFRGLLRIQKNQVLRQALEGKGIRLFSKEGAVLPIEQLLPQLKNLSDYLEKMGLSEEALVSLFGRPDAARALMMVMRSYDDLIRKQRDLENSTGGLARDFNLETNSMRAQWVAFKNTLESFSIQHFETPLKWLTKGLDELNKHPLIAKGILTGAAIFGGLLAVNKAIGWGRDILGMFKGGKGAGGALGGAAGAGAGIPVYVTNWPGSFGGLPGGTGSEIPGKGIPGGVTLPVPGSVLKKTWELGKKVLPVAARVAGPAAAGIAAYEAASWAESKWIKGYFGEKLYDILHGEMGAKTPVVENEINMQIRIDDRDRITTETSGMNTRINVDTMKRGLF